jgi:hypothetical protein
VLKEQHFEAQIIEDPACIPDTFCQKIGAIECLPGGLYRITLVVVRNRDPRALIATSHLIWSRDDLEIAHRQVAAVLGGMPFLPSAERSEIVPH